MNCKICSTKSAQFTEKKVLGKYDVKYFQCPTCQFIQTEEPYWLTEAYANAITNLDIGLAYRNEYLAPIVSTIINLFFKDKGPYLDYGGGYGLFVRMMRDRGFNFYRLDIYCENIFAKHFDVKDIPGDSKFGLITAFEVFEHLTDPIVEIEKMLSYGDHILFSTELQPLNKNELDKWWYFTPETGQHNSLYSQRSLEIIAQKFGLYFYSRNNIHLFSKTKLNSFVYKLGMNKKVSYLVGKLNKRNSFLMKDFEKIKSGLPTC